MTFLNFHDLTIHFDSNHPIRYNTMSKRFLDDGNGRVAGVETVLVEWTKVMQG